MQFGPLPVLYVIFVEDLHLVRWQQDTSEHAHGGDSASANGAAAPELVHA